MLKRMCKDNKFKWTSAIAQTNIFMLEVRSVCTCTKCEPLKEKETETPPVEFVAELIQVKLQESIL